jgi:hypothetical protein
VLPRPLAAFLRLGANYVAHFVAGFGRIQHANHGSNPEPCQKPQEAVAVTFRHDYLLKDSLLCISDGSTLICEKQFSTAHRDGSVSHQTGKNQELPRNFLVSTFSFVYLRALCR